MVTNSQHHFLAARSRKEGHYVPLLLDLQHAGFSVDLVEIEVGCLGHLMPVTVTKLSNVCHLLKSTICYILQQAACIAISCLYRLFNAQASAS